MIYYVLLAALPNDVQVIQEFDGREITSDDRFWEARAASAGVLVGFLLLGWGPFYLWKFQVCLHCNA